MTLVKQMPVRLMVPLVIFAVLVGLLIWVTLIFFASASELRAAAKEDGRYARIEISTGMVEGNVTLEGQEEKVVSQMPKRRGKSILAQRQDEATTIDGANVKGGPAPADAEKPAGNTSDKKEDKASAPEQKEEIEVANVPAPEVPEAPIESTVEKVATEEPNTAEAALPASSSQPVTNPKKELLEKVSGVEIPKRAAGERALDAYKKPYKAGGSPKIAVVITNVGMVADQNTQALALPENVTLSLSPYAASLDGLREKAQSAGHEIWLDLPMQPKNYPADDAGPLSLMSAEAESENITRLHKVLGAATNYVGVVAPADENFTGSAKMKPVVSEIDRRGVGLLIQRSGYKDANAASYLRQAERAVSSDNSVEAAKRALTEAETLAKQTGSAVVTLPATPALLKLVKSWSSGLEGKGVELAPLSALYAKDVSPATAKNE